jgi:nucleoside-diphosphate-sugar epimerase
MNFGGKVAIVAGAGGGMGLNIANDLISEGARVCLADIKPRPEAVRDGPGESIYCQGDLSEDDFVKSTVAQTAERFGRLDYLVNTVGVLWFGRDRSLIEIDLATWDRVLEVNLKSFVLTARHAIPHMKESGGGAMVHFSSTQALRGDAVAQDAYGAKMLMAPPKVQSYPCPNRLPFSLPATESAPMRFCLGPRYHRCKSAGQARKKRSAQASQSGVSARRRTRRTHASFCCRTRRRLSLARNWWSTAEPPQACNYRGDRRLQ